MAGAKAGKRGWDAEMEIDAEERRKSRQKEEQEKNEGGGREK